MSIGVLLLSVEPHTVACLLLRWLRIALVQPPTYDIFVSHSLHYAFPSPFSTYFHTSDSFERLAGMILYEQFC